MILIISCIVLAIVLGITLSCEYYTLTTGVPTAASFPAARQKIVQVLRNTATSPHTIIDLGSGGGQLSLQIAQAIPNAHVIGIEISFLPWLRSVVHQHMSGTSNVTFDRVDFWSYDVSKADAIVVFLTGNIMNRVSEKLRKELKTGAIIVANDVPLSGDWVPVETIPNATIGIIPSNIYVYRQG